VTTTTLDDLDPGLRDRAATWRVVERTNDGATLLRGVEEPSAAPTVPAETP
jgi:hypothetical protein